jgi:hypothetical protein
VAETFDAKFWEAENDRMAIVLKLLEKFTRQPVAGTDSALKNSVLRKSDSSLLLKPEG